MCRTACNAENDEYATWQRFVDRSVTMFVKPRGNTRAFATNAAWVSRPIAAPERPL
jgi:hypothetical protein